VTRIFINYRRRDTKETADRLSEWLAERYGDDQVFMDVDDIAPGRPWREAIDRAVGSSDLVLAVIGRDWLPELNRRLADEDDFVRRELEAALSRDVSIIPVLAKGARMPRSDELPTSLAPLSEYQAFELLGRYDKQELLKSVARALDGGERTSWFQRLKHDVRARRRRYVALAGGLVLAVGVTAIALILASGGSEPQHWITKKVAQEPITNLSCPTNNCSQPSLAPDGARMAFIGRKNGSVYVAEMNGPSSSGSRPVAGAKHGLRPSLDRTGRVVFRNQRDQRIWYTDRSQQNAKSLTGPGYSDPVWSPDGTQVAYVSTTGDGTLLKIDVPSGGQQIVARAPGAKISVPAWSPDGTQLAYVRASADCPEPGDIWIVKADGSDDQQLLALSGDERHPTWSPDGKQIAFSSNVADPQNYDLYTVDADGKNLARRTTDFKDEVGPSWGADGIAYARGFFECGGGSDQKLWFAQPVG
jgi:TIR domain-containing protein/WD40 repeat protein